jgi:methyl-accepting chemotaxis protein
MGSLSIVKKQLLGFGLLLCLMVGTAVFAVSRMNMVDRNLTTMNDANSVKQRYAINFRGSVHNRAIALRDVILVQSPSEMPAVLTDIEYLEDKYQASAGPLDAMVTPDRAPLAEETSTLAAIKNTESRTNPLVHKVITLAQAGNQQAAHDLLMQQVRPLFNEWLKEINQFIDLEEASNKALAISTRTATSQFQLVLGLIVLAALAAGGSVIWWSTRETRQLPLMANRLKAMAEGDRTVEIPSADTRNELGDLARAMMGFRDQLRAADAAKETQVALICDSVGTGLNALAKGNLTTRVDADLTGPFAKLKDDFNNAASTLQTAMQAVAQSAGGINAGAGEIRQASDDLSRRTEQQAASLEETAATMDQLTTAVRQTASGAERASGLVGEARGDAEQGGQVVRRAVEAMDGIEGSSNEISKIISVIDGIAFQTNLLALNAGVEAARAGDAGRGFAVVASEVRALAQRSADAARDVKARIHASSEQVSAGVELVGETGKSLARIIARIVEVSQLVSEIASSAQQQATGLQQVNTAIAEMDGVTQKNAAMVEQATAAARSLAGEADELTRQVARFETGSDAASRRAERSVRSPVHALQQWGETGRRPAPRLALGNAAVAVADDNWSEF